MPEPARKYISRNTRQKEIVRGIFQSSSLPLTPTEVLTEGRKKIPNLGLNTVYRQIKELLDAKAILGVDYPGQPVRYEWATGQHRTHFVCRDCNKVIPIDIEIPDAEVSLPAPFVMEGQETILFGRCQNAGDCSLGKDCPQR